jgi:hypothetical protein
MECATCGKRAMRFVKFFGGRGKPELLCQECAAGRRGAPRCVRCGGRPAAATFVFIGEEDRIETTGRYCAGCADVLKQLLAGAGLRPLPDDPAAN